MAHFAKLDGTNKVIGVYVVNNDVITDDNGDEQEQLGIEFLSTLYGGGSWKQTSYNRKFRRNYAGVGMTYDEIKDAFIPIKRFPSWTLNESTYEWEAPTSEPDDGKDYMWNEDTKSWDLVNE